MRAWRSRVTLLMLASTILQTFAVAPSSADHFFGRLWRLEEEKWYDGKEPANMCSDDAIQELAMNIDWLEHHIDTYGSIVAKQPDIWGEARMTKHRDEYERMMYEQLNQFKYSINAAIRQEDSAFLAQAFALSAAVDGESGGPASTATTVKVDNDAVTSSDEEVVAATVSAPNITADDSDIKLPDSGEIGLEPTVFLDQMSRYLQHLHELRRINEGDDTSDSPGYALNLVRIPVSALPGKLTREGWGAEVTVTATPILSADLMPTTFRNLVINDLVDTLGLPLVRLAERHPILPIPETMPTDQGLRDAQFSATTDSATTVAVENALRALDSPDPASEARGFDTNLFNNQVEMSINRAVNATVAPALSTARSRRATNPLPPSHLTDVIGYTQLYGLSKFFCPNYQGANVRWKGDPRCDSASTSKEFRVNLLDAQSWLATELAAAHEMLSQPNHLLLWYALANPSSGLARAIRSEHFKSDMAGRPGVADFRHAFFALLHSHEAIPVDSFSQSLPCLDDMRAPTDNTKLATAKTVAEALAWAIVVESALLNQRLNEDVRKTAEAKHAYSIPQSDEDLNFFLPETAGQPNSPLLEEFSAATPVFQEYVRVRWPIHVFAIDPREQDQNVADASARRRELQFALALGFVSGQVSANSLTNFSRELQTDVETISLNRTAVGFAHGHDTFGWRFFPRVQALDVPGAGGAIWQTIHGASRDHDMRKRQLEPGMRECVAIVLMPSFVPYADFDVRTNWFRLTNPKNAALTMKDTMKLSRAITAMRNSQAQCARCAHCYRDGEVERLLKRVEQLDRELPLQTMRAQIPYENTLGGFEMFNTGVTDLAPELVGWYGAPGVVITSPGLDNQYACGCFKQCEHCQCETCNNCPACTCPTTATGETAPRPLQQPLAVCQGQGTTLFLVGDHLSVHDTKIIAGGVCIPHVQLVSRQIVRVTIPSCVNTVDVDGKPYVAVYAATPYGVTSHLHIPIHDRDLTGESKSKIEAAVKAEVVKAVKTEVAAALREPLLERRNASVKLAAVVKPIVEATCKVNSSFDLTLKNGQFAVNVTTYGPALSEQPVRLYFAIRHGGNYITPLIELAPIVSPEEEATPIRFPKTNMSQDFDVLIADGTVLVNSLESVFPTMIELGGKKTISLSADVYGQSGSESPWKLEGGIAINLEVPCECCKAPSTGNANVGGATDETTSEPTPADAPQPPAPPAAPVGAPVDPQAPTAAPGGEALPPLLPSAPSATSTAPGCNCPQAAVENPFRR
jgi:hypothetical protein